MEIHGEIGKKGFDLGLSVFQIGARAHLVKQDIPFYPGTVAAFGADGVVPAPHGTTHFIQQWCGHRGLFISLISRYQADLPDNQWLQLK